MATRGKKPRRPKQPVAMASKRVQRPARHKRAARLESTPREAGMLVKLHQMKLAPTTVRHGGALRAVKAAENAFTFVELLVPRRIAAEEIGDALEEIVNMVREERPVWHVYVKIVATFLWIFAHAAREIVKGPATKRKKRG